MLESTLLEIINPALTSWKHILKVLGHSTKGDLYNSPCTLYHLMCTLKAYVLESTLLEIQTLLWPPGSISWNFQVTLPKETSWIIQAHQTWLCAYWSHCAYMHTKKTLATMPIYPRVPVGSFKVISGRRALSKSKKETQRYLRINYGSTDRPTDGQINHRVSHQN